MHHRYFVLTDKANAKTSLQARTYVESWLNEEGFAGEGTRFSSSFCDWFVIGGRWSGELVKRFLDQEKLKLFWEEFERQKLDYYPPGTTKEEQKKKSPCTLR